MKQARALSAAIILVVVLCHWLSGCSIDERHVAPRANDPQLEETRVRVVPEQEEQAIIEEILSDPRLELCAELFSTSGLDKSPSSAVTLEGFSSDGIPIRLTILGFQGADSTVSGFVAYIEGKDTTAVCPCIIRSKYGSIVPGQGDYALVEYEVTKEGLVVPFGDISADSTGEAWSWGTFWHCLRVESRERTPDLVGCAAGCVFAGPAYFKCLLACGGGVGVAITVDCAMQQLD